MSLSAVVQKVQDVLHALQASPLYPERKVINGAVAGAVTAVVVALGLSASPLAAALATLVVAKVTAYLSKPSVQDDAKAAVRDKYRKDA